MRRYRSLTKIILGIALLAAIAVGSNQITAGEKPIKLRILYTDDMMGNWLPCG